MVDSLGNRLKSLRTKKGLTQLQVGNRIGVSKGVISSYELSNRTPPYDILIKLASLYNVSTDYLLGLENKRTVDISGLTDNQINTIMTLIDTFKHP
jgi:transcriptional regulator with XRE-family HTH domain